MQCKYQTLVIKDQINALAGVNWDIGFHRNLSFIANALLHH